MNGDRVWVDIKHTKGHIRASCVTIGVIRPVMYQMKIDLHTTEKSSTPAIRYYNANTS